MNNMYDADVNQNAPANRLTSVLDSAHAVLLQAHEVIDNLEDRLQGSQPRPAEDQSNGSAATHPGVQAVAEQTNKLAQSVLDRLANLLGHI